MRRKAEYRRPENEFTGLEFMQHQLLPQCMQRIGEAFEAGHLATPFEWALRYHCIINDRKLPHGDRVSKYEYLLADSHLGRSHTIERGPKAPGAHNVERLAALAPDAARYSKNLYKNAICAPLTPNKGLWLEGRTHIKHGMRPSRVADCWQNPAGEHMRECLEPDEQLPPDRVIVHPGINTYLPDLETTAGQFPQHNASPEDVLHTVMVAGDRLEFRHILDAETFHTTGGVKINPKAASGFDLQGLGGNRGGTAQCTERLAQRVVEEIEDTTTPPPGSYGIWQIGGRAKRASPQAGEKLKSRAVIFDNAVSATVSSCLSQPMGDMIKQSHGEIQIGHTAVRGGAARDAAKSAGNVIENEIDHKRYGFRVTEQSLVDSFGVIRACLPRGDKYDRWILHEMSKVILKFMILPGGWVYRWTFGNPSGPWTSILDSISNWLSTRTALDLCGVMPHESSCWIYGDDTLIGFRSWEAWRPNSMIQTVLYDKFGILPGDASYGSLSSWGDEPGATFLGCWMKDGLYGRPLAKWLDVSVLPEHNHTSLAMQMKRCAYLEAAAVCTLDNQDYFQDYFKWVNSKAPLHARIREAALHDAIQAKMVKAHTTFSNGGVDTREWETGAKLRLDDAKSAYRASKVSGQDLDPSLPPRPLVSQWLSNPPRGARRGPSILGFIVEDLSGATFRNRPRYHCPILGG
jgi:hypothetical protein